MSVGPASGTSAISGPEHDGIARWAIWVAAVVVVVVAVSYLIFGVTFAIGGDSAVSDTVVGYLAGGALLGGLVASLAAFVMAVVAAIRHQMRPLLWLPLALFPTFVVVVGLVEAFWME